MRSGKDGLADRREPAARKLRLKDMKTSFFLSITAAVEMWNAAQVHVVFCLEFLTKERK